MRSWELKGLNQNEISVWILLFHLQQPQGRLNTLHYRDIATYIADCTPFWFYKKHKEIHGLIEGIYTLMATLRSAKHQQLMFLLKHSVSKVKKYTSFTNLLLKK